MPPKEIFDDLPESYDAWFETPIGALVKKYEAELVMEMLDSRPGECILDAGCGTGVFTADFLSAGASVIGLDVSRPMLDRARNKSAGRPFYPVMGDVRRLPFKDECFDKTASVTALEFVPEATAAVREMFRVTRPGGLILVATLNSLSPWAPRRKKAAEKEGGVFAQAIFRSPGEVQAFAPYPCLLKTCVFFEKDENPVKAERIEAEGRKAGLETGAFLAACWKKSE